MIPRYRHFGRIAIWWFWGLWKFSFKRYPSPFMPYEWALYLGPFCICWVTKAKPRRMSRQQRRYLERQIAKRRRSLKRAGVL